MDNSTITRKHLIRETPHQHLTFQLGIISPVRCYFSQHCAWQITEEQCESIQSLIMALAVRVWAHQNHLFSLCVWMLYNRGRRRCAGEKLNVQNNFHNNAAFITLFEMCWSNKWTNRWVDKWRQTQNFCCLPAVKMAHKTTD